MNSLGWADERQASWKLLLPLMPGAQALVVGSGVWLVTALARSGLVVDWLRKDGVVGGNELVDGELKDSVFLLESLDGKIKAYDLIVAAEAKLSLSFLTKITADRLKTDGVLVQLALDCPPWKADEVLSRGFVDCFFLSALPPGNPRLFFPLSPAKFCQSALSFHLPGSRRAHVGLTLLKTAFSCRFTLPLRRRGVVVCGRRKLDLSVRENSLALWLSKRLSRRVENLAVYCGSESRRRKMTLLLDIGGKEGEELLVAKVADTAAGAEAIRQESEALCLLEQSGVRCGFPRLFLEENWGQHLVQVQEAFPPGLERVDGVIRAEHLEVLASFAGVGRREVPLAETREWLRVSAVCENRISNLPGKLRDLWEICLASGDKKETRIPVHLVHGDFASWNMRWRDDRLAVFDWEDSFPDGLAYGDLFRFVYRQASLIGPWPGGERLYYLLTEKITALNCLVDDYNSSLFETIMPLLLLGEYLERPHRHLLEVAKVFLKRHG